MSRSASACSRALVAALALCPSEGCVDGDRPLVVGHRGLPGAYPDNTVAGFVAAADDGADALETDLWLTRDGVVVLAHDGDLSCFTLDCDGAIADHTAAEVQACALPPAGDGGVDHRIPTLEQALDATAGRYGHHFLEIKLRSPPERLAAIAEAALTLTHVRDLPGVVWHSFDPAGLTALRSAADKLSLPSPTVGLQLLTDSGIDFSGGCPETSTLASEAEAERLDADWVLWAGTLLDRMDVLSARAGGRRVSTWGGDSPALIHRALDLDADAIFTDSPALVRALVDAR